MEEFVKVVCALLIKNNKILLTQRSANMSNSLKWEFPGGKVRMDETAFEAIIRECKEELEINVIPEKIGTSVFHSYPHIKIELIPVFCTSNGEKIHLTEHENFTFSTFNTLLNFDLSIADKKIIEANKLT